jgi:hypothetical protein
MAPCAIHIQCRRRGPGEWENPTLRVAVARLRHGIYVFHDGRMCVAGLLVERIPDLVAAILAIGAHNERRDHYLYLVGMRKPRALRTFAPSPDMLF